MGNIKAVLIGVSKNHIFGFSDLPFCLNDILEMKKALIHGLKVNEENIYICGENGDVHSTEFLETLKKVKANVDEEDILIFYFSGHGETTAKGHHLVLSDLRVATQFIIDILKDLKANSKIIFLDCCMSGNYEVDSSASFDIEQTVEEFHGNGYAVLSSSNATQYSYGHPDKPISVFTSFLSNAIQDKYMNREGRKSLYDIKRLVSLYLDVWSRKNPDKSQHPIFRANMGGTIFFEVEKYEPYILSNIYKEYDDFIIYEVKPSHNISAKRYTVKVILKDSFTLEEIADISQEIVGEAKGFEIYSNEISDGRFRGKPANIVWIYFCRSESDIKQGNYICHTTWIDGSQDKEWWYRVDSKNRQFIKAVHFNIHPYYEYLKNFIIENTGDRNRIIEEMKEILSMMVTLAEKVIYQYNEFRNDVIDEYELVEVLHPIINEIDKYHSKSTELDIADDSIHEWNEACTFLFALIHNFICYYNEKYLSSRTAENRIACMDMTIRDYYVALNKVKEFEEQVEESIS